MKISEAQSTVAAHAAVAAANDDGSNAVEPPRPAEVVDRVTTDEAVQFRSSVANGVQMAASERTMRLQALTHAVRSGGYHPSASQLADQILAQAELDARLAKALR